MKQERLLNSDYRRSTGKGRGRMASKEQPEESNGATGELGTEETQPEEELSGKESEPEGSRTGWRK